MFVTPSGESQAEVDITTRRAFLGAIGAGSALVPMSIAQSQTSAGRGTSQLFWTADTTSGRVQRNSVRRSDRGPEPLYAPSKAGRMDRRARMLRNRTGLPADTGRPSERLFHVDPVGSTYRRNGRGLPLVERMDPR